MIARNDVSGVCHLVVDESSSRLPVTWCGLALEQDPDHPDHPDHLHVRDALLQGTVYRAEDRPDEDATCRTCVAWVHTVDSKTRLDQVMRQRQVGRFLDRP